MSIRSRVAVGFAGVCAGALLFAAMPALAAAGDALILGQSNNAGTSSTQVSTNTDGPGFKFTNNFGANRAAARINVGCGPTNKMDCAPPFATDSQGKVLHFNSDYLDGYDSDELKVLHQFDADENPADATGFILAVTIDASTSGYIDAQGVIDMSFVNEDLMECAIYVDGDQVVTSDVDLSLQSGDDGPCVTVASVPVGPGSYLVQLRIGSINDTNHNVQDSTLQATFIPADVTPSAAALGAATEDAE